MTGEIHITSRIDGGDAIRKELSRLGAQAQGKARKAVREVSLAAERGIKDAMPVLTGRARASWGHWTPEGTWKSFVKGRMGAYMRSEGGHGGAMRRLGREWRSRKQTGAGLVGSAEDSHWVERDGGLTIEQGSNLEYISLLNQGHSQQAPAGFIDKVVERASHALNRLLAEIVGR